jgi:hypothetical protein
VVRPATLLVTPLATAWMLKRPEGELFPEALIGALYEPLTGLDGFVTVTAAGLELFGFDERPALNVGDIEALLGVIVNLIVTFVSPDDMFSGVGLNDRLRMVILALTTEIVVHWGYKRQIRPVWMSTGRNVAVRVNFPGATVVITPEELTVATEVLLLLQPVVAIAETVPLQSVPCTEQFRTSPTGQNGSKGNIARLTAQQLMQVPPQVASATLKMPPAITRFILFPGSELSKAALPSTILDGMTFPVVSGIFSIISMAIPIMVDPWGSRCTGRRYFPEPSP